MKMEASIRVVQPQPRSTWSHQKLEKTGTSLSESLQRNTALISVASRIVREYISLSKSPVLGYFVKATLGN